MARQIVWTVPAEKDLKRILNHWLERNGTPNFSLKLYGRIRTTVALTIRNPFIGRPTDIVGIRVLRVGEYLIFYEVMVNAILVHHVWDGRQDMTKLEF